MTIKQRVLRNKCIIALLSVGLSFPILLVLLKLTGVTSEAWYHLQQNLLTDYIENTFWVVLGVSLLSLMMGVSCAWWIATTNFPFRKQLEWLLILPLSIPTFINGITYSGIIDYTGPVRVFLRSQNWTDPSMDLFNIPGVILVMSLVLYPYVYLTSKFVFALQSSSRIEAARMLGRSNFQTFVRVALPIGWPGIFAGLLLVIMEVLNDYGTVHYYGVSTFTTGIFKSWLSMGDIASAVMLSVFLIVFVMLLLYLDQRLQRGKRYTTVGKQVSRKNLMGGKKWMVLIACSLPFVFGFIVPVAQMVYWLFLSAERTNFAALLKGLGGTVQLAAVAGTLIVILAWVNNFFLRRQTLSGIWKGLSKLSLLGYSMPGAVVGIGVVAMILFIQPQWLFATTLALIIGYITRFYAVGHNPILAGYQKIPLSMDESANIMGMRAHSVLTKIHFPLLNQALLAAFVMVFIDISKELPLTLILRPFNYETLATQAFQFAKDEMAAESAAPSLMIIGVSAIPVYFLNRIFGSRT